MLSFPALSQTVRSARPNWFASARLPGPYLTRSCLVFSATLTTPALYRRSLRWFEASPAGRLRRAFLHLLHSTAFRFFLLEPPSAFRVHTKDRTLPSREIVVGSERYRMRKSGWIDIVCGQYLGILLVLMPLHLYLEESLP